MSTTYASVSCRTRARECNPQLLLIQFYIIWLTIVYCQLVVVDGDDSDLLGKIENFHLEIENSYDSLSYYLLLVLLVSADQYELTTSPK